MIALVLAAAALACEADARIVDVQAALGTARERFRALDAAGFADAVDDAVAGVDCLVEPMAPSAVADLHRMVGLAAFSRKDLDGAMLAFAAARAVEPDTALPTELLPPTHPAHDDYTAVDPAVLGSSRVGEARAGQLRFDGRASVVRPLERPAVLQLVDDDARVLTSVYLRPGDPMPDYRARRVRSPAELPLAVAAAIGVGAGAALLGAAAGSRAAYDNLDHGSPAGQAGLDGARTRTNRLVAASAAVGGLGVVSGVALAAVVAF